MIDQTSPAEVAFFALVEAENARKVQRLATINADPRIIRLRAMKSHPTIDSAADLMLNLLSGNSARSARIARLLRARTGQLDKNRAAVQINLREAAICRHTHWSLVA